MIFSWFLNGISQNAIIHKLNESGILCPSAYKKSKGLKYQNPNTVNDLSLWSTISVRNILRNRIYVGDMVQGRYRMKSYKIHIQENVPEEEWFIVENTHEPIISREDFKKVQSLLMKDTRTAPGKNKLYLFSGLLRCGDCKKGMSRSTVGKNTYYYCRTYKNQLKTACTKHMIKHNELEQGVLQSIKQLIYIAADFSKILSHIQATPQQKNQSLRLQKLITSKEKELSGITYYRRSIYQDWKDGEITHDDYIDMRKEYECQIKELGKKIDTLRKEKDELESIENLENPLLSSFRKHANIDKLTRDLLIDLVDQITVYEGKKIKIRFKFSFLFLIM
jgi:hypothetical protein